MFVQTIGMSSWTNTHCLPKRDRIQYVPRLHSGKKITLSSIFSSFIFPSVAHPLTLKYVQWCSMAQECLREMWKEAQPTRLPSLMCRSAKEGSPHSGARGSSQIIEHQRWLHSVSQTEGFTLVFQAGRNEWCMGVREKTYLKHIKGTR